MPLPSLFRFFLLLAFAALAASASAQSGEGLKSEAAKPQATRTTTVNGRPIPKSRVDFIVHQRTAQGEPDTPELRSAILDGLISQEVVAQEAERRGIARRPDVQTQLELAREQVLIQAYLQDYFRTHPIKDEQLLAEYNKLKAARGEKEYHPRHILVDTEAEAKQIIAQLKKGAKFEDLAKQSKDPGSRDRGGDLDWHQPGDFVKPFSDAMVKLAKGQYTETPVQTQFGWHVIRLDDVRPAQFPAFDSVKPQIRTMIQQQEVQQLVQALRAKAKIE